MIFADQVRIKILSRASLTEVHSVAEAKPTFRFPLPRSQSLGSRSLCRCTSRALSIPREEHVICGRWLRTAGMMGAFEIAS